MNEERKYVVEHSITLPEIHGPGWVLDLGGGGEGVIGQLGDVCGCHVVSIDRLRHELEDAPGGALKIVMDAGQMQFLDSTFFTAFSFFFFLFVPPSEREKIFIEVFRVLKPGGRWLLWDAFVPPFPGGEKDIYLIRLTVNLPGGRVVRTGYGALWPERQFSAADLLRLAAETGFEVAACSEDRLSFAVELFKPPAAEPAQP